jgi:hypothetical protein
MTIDRDQGTAASREVMVLLRERHHCSDADIISVLVPLVGVLLQEMPAAQARAVLRRMTDTLMMALGMEAGRR